MEGSHAYQMYITINTSGNLQTIHDKGGLLFEHKKNDVNGEFTCFAQQGNLIYAGTQKGNIVVFD